MSDKIQNLRISTSYGQSADHFGGRDFLAARQLGYSDQEILNYLNKNPDKLRMQNVIGGGGLYDNLKAGTVDTYLGPMIKELNLPGTPSNPGPGSDTNEPDYKGLLDGLKIEFGELGKKFEGQKGALEDMRTDAAAREKTYNDQLNNMIRQQSEAQQQFQQQAAAQQRSFETAQRVSASNMARGGQQTDYRLGSAANALRGGTAGFQRRPKSTMPVIGAAGFSAPVAGKGSAKTLNV